MPETKSLFVEKAGLRFQILQSLYVFRCLKDFWVSSRSLDFFENQFFVVFF